MARAPQQDFPAVRAFVERMVADGRVPAISVSVAIGDAPPTFYSAGHVTLDPRSTASSPDTLWRVYSMTKPITAIAAMILVDDGKISLDQPVGDFISTFKTSRVLVDPAKGLETRAATRPITIRDLMTHSSGLNYGIAGDSPAVAALKKDGVTPYQFSRAGEAELRPQRAASLQEFGIRAGRTPLIADPGTKFSYSMGLDVLAAVVEKASATPFEQFVARRLLQPLGMKSTYWQVPRDRAGMLAGDYVPRAFAAFAPGGVNDRGDGPFLTVDPGPGSIYLDRPSFAYGGAGLVSTARDYDRFLHMLENGGTLDGHRVLRAATARLAMSNLLPPGVNLANFGPIAPGEQAGFGAGGFVITLPVDGFGRHRGTYGWDGAAGSRAWVDPARRLRVTMMINTMGAVNVANELEKAVAADYAAIRP